MAPALGRCIFHRFHVQGFARLLNQAAGGWHSTPRRLFLVSRPFFVAGLLLEGCGFVVGLCSLSRPLVMAGLFGVALLVVPLGLIEVAALLHRLLSPVLQFDIFKFCISLEPLGF